MLFCFLLKNLPLNRLLLVTKPILLIHLSKATVEIHSSPGFSEEPLEEQTLGKLLFISEMLEVRQFLQN